jgi:hypothetical protein
MATYEVNKTDLAKIIEKSPASVTGKMSGEIEWKRPDMVNITTYFKKLDPTITMDKIFCTDGN